MSIIAKNLKKLRLQKNLTQEQAAEVLGISTQTISRWERNATCPDIMLLPEIARLYCVTVDDLFQDDPSAYDNYAQRLSSVFEISGKPEDYLKANVEYNKLKEIDRYTLDDQLKHGAIHTSMMLSCRQHAIQNFNEIINKCEKDKNISPDNTTYWSARYHILHLYISTGQAAVHQKQKERLEKHADNYMEWTVLIYAYYYAGENEKAYKSFREALEKFSDKWEIYMVGGYVCKALKKYDEAIMYCDKSYTLGAKYLDALYTKAFCLQEMGDYKQAYTTWLQIIDVLKKEGYDVEIQREQKRAQACLEKIYQG